MSCTCGYRRGDATAHEAWCDSAKYPLSAWQHEVANEDTRLGYEEWVRIKVDEARDEVTYAAWDWLEQLHASWPQFNSNEPINGTDLVEDLAERWSRLNEIIRRHV